MSPSREQPWAINSHDDKHRQLCYVTDILVLSVFQLSFFIVTPHYLDFLNAFVSKTLLYLCHDCQLVSNFTKG